MACFLEGGSNRVDDDRYNHILLRARIYIVFSVANPDFRQIYSNRQRQRSSAVQPTHGDRDKRTAWSGEIPKSFLLCPSVASRCRCVSVKLHQRDKHTKGQKDKQTCPFSTPLSHRISMTSYLFRLLVVTTHAFHHYVSPIKAYSSLKVTHRSFRYASPHPWNQLPTSLRIPHPNYSSPSQRPSFEHTGLTCYTLLSPSITFSLFHSELKTYLFRK